MVRLEVNTYLMQRPTDLGMLVVVGGPGGTGSSTIAKILAEKWGLHRVDAGEMMRNRNQQKDFSDFLVDRVTRHPEIDRFIDQFMVKMSYYPNILIEGKFFAPIATAMGIPCTIKVWITADIPTRVHRILEREGRLKEQKIADPESALFISTREELMKRQSNDEKRCRHLYHIDLSQPELFSDIVLDTTGLNVPFTIKQLFDMIKTNDTLKKRFSPKHLKL